NADAVKGRRPLPPGRAVAIIGSRCMRTGASLFAAWRAGSRRGGSGGRAGWSSSRPPSRSAGAGCGRGPPRRSASLTGSRAASAAPSPPSTRLSPIALFARGRRPDPARPGFLNFGVVRVAADGLLVVEIRDADGAVATDEQGRPGALTLVPTR